MRSAWCALSRSLCADDASFALSLAISSSCSAAPGQDAARVLGPAELCGRRRQAREPAGRYGGGRGGGETAAHWGV